MRFAFLVSCFVLACGGTTTDGDAGVDSGGDGASPDAFGDATGPFSCGTATCSANEVCVHPCCGGAPPPCYATDDAGACPPGTSTTNPGFCPPQSPGPCVPDPCTPPPEYCSGDTSSCQPVGHDCYEACGGL